MADSSVRSGGISFIGLLTIVFIVLKLIGKIDWSWWWVLGPLWIGPLIIIVIVVLFSILALWASPKRRRW